ncbi:MULTISPECIES: exonuclease domain-containing protein [unclassified Saccharopolyspora]|uniref:exonuclease domain-containing protein n=1 Tax=unclassified Saccharopolyspora TaxID=2646250 RepID=UPI001CD215E1|nr:MULTISPECIES: exonuclease domain-containing protein [unclassified Saccharopolyspora]MCA1188842.1 hypothetical protein [Saccharopolyspora sp. 6T]MCA1195748.1 hypothetical protein [Saccharopolyspora sp. 6V]MCA1228408.1 hypothetical protein [Saccharopolyspora sp. 6M]MCA1281882.1 hypothetical protein [Saccharopolyspora sp. 7B]
MSWGYAVIDVETTGLRLRSRHRIAEIAVVLLDPSGAVQEEWCTLINPQRDLGPQHVHGISAADARNAPVFAEIAPELSRLFTGRVLVAHNLSFDLGFLAEEFDRLGFDVAESAPAGLCTMLLAHDFLRQDEFDLASCCASTGVPLVHAHAALHDARAAAGLLRHYLRTAPGDARWREAERLARTSRWPAPTGPVAVPVHRSAAAANAMPVPPLTVDIRLAPRDSVVFTGETSAPREQWIDRAERAELTVRAYVTKKTRLLIAADADSQSRKAETARKYGIPIVTEHGFSQLLAGLDRR